MWLQAQDIVLRARHIPGCLNVIADRLLRPNQLISTEWNLNSEIVNRIFQFWELQRWTCLPQSTIPAYLSSDSRASSTGSGCSVSGLAGEINVHVCTISSAQQSHSEIMCHPGSRSNTYSSMVAITTMVSTHTSTLCRPASVLSIPPRSTLSTGSEIHLRVKDVPSPRMKALMQHYKAAVFSDEVSRLAAAARRPSTNRMYYDWWLRFTHWAIRIGFDPLNPTAAQIATFLYSWVIASNCQRL